MSGGVGKVFEKNKRRALLQDIRVAKRGIIY